LDGVESGAFITSLKDHLPGCVKRFFCERMQSSFPGKVSWLPLKQGFTSIIASKKAKPPFDPRSWYQPRRSNPIQYNSCVYQPIGWTSPCRFVAMRIPKEEDTPPGQPLQGELFEEDRYTYRIFCTDLRGKAHKIISKYDKRADTENLIGKPSARGLMRSFSEV